MKICSVDGCDVPVYLREWCRPHYHRWQRHGDPTAGRPSPGEPQKRFAAALETETDECILWPHQKRQDGYGLIKRSGVAVRVHVLVCEHCHGIRPTPSHEVAHSCGNPSCVNHRHLRWATHTENMADALRHGTRQLGEMHHSAKLTRDQVLAIRRREGESSSALGREFGVAPRTIRGIIARQRWASV